MAHLRLGDTARTLMQLLQMAILASMIGQVITGLFSSRISPLHASLYH